MGQGISLGPRVSSAGHPLSCPSPGPGAFSEASLPTGVSSVTLDPSHMTPSAPAAGSWPFRGGTMVAGPGPGSSCDCVTLVSLVPHRAAVGTRVGSGRYSSQAQGSLGPDSARLGSAPVVLAMVLEAIGRLWGLLPSFCPCLARTLHHPHISDSSPHLFSFLSWDPLGPPLLPSGKTGGLCPAWISHCCAVQGHC